MSAAAAGLIVAGLVLIILERKKYKCAIAVLPITLVAACLLWVSEELGLYSGLNLLGYILGAVAAGLCVAVSVLTFFWLRIKGEPVVKKKKVKMEPDWTRDYDYNINLARATESLAHLKELYEKGYLTEKEYRDERMYALYTYRIGKMARFSNTFRGYEARRWYGKDLPKELFTRDDVHDEK